MICRVVLAWLGLKAAALAWPGAALACSIPRLGQSCQLWLGFGLAWPGLWLLYAMMKKKKIHAMLILLQCAALIRLVHILFNKKPIPRKFLNFGVISRPLQQPYYPALGCYSLQLLLLMMGQVLKRVNPVELHTSWIVGPQQCHP